MYTNINFPTKKAFKAAVDLWNKSQNPVLIAASLEPVAKPVTLFAPGLGTPKVNGTEYVEGPWFPKPHTWYAQVEVKDGIVVRVK